MSPALIAALACLALGLAIAVVVTVAEYVGTRRRNRAAARVATYLRRQEQARQAVDAETLLATAQRAAHSDALDRAFDRAKLHGGPIRPVDRYTLNQPGDARALLAAGTHPGQRRPTPTAAQPAAVVERTGVVLELYPPRPTPTARTRADAMAAHPAGRARHAAPVLEAQP